MTCLQPSKLQLKVLRTPAIKGFNRPANVFFKLLLQALDLPLIDLLCFESGKRLAHNRQFETFNTIINLLHRYAF